jgi:hypothetical protein
LDQSIVAGSAASAGATASMAKPITNANFRMKASRGHQKTCQLNYLMANDESVIQIKRSAIYRALLKFGALLLDVRFGS